LAAKKPMWNFKFYHQNCIDILTWYVILQVLTKRWHVIVVTCRSSIIRSSIINCQLIVHSLVHCAKINKKIMCLFTILLSSGTAACIASRWLQLGPSSYIGFGKEISYLVRYLGTVRFQNEPENIKQPPGEINIFVIRW
jgi:hypothetical protein